MSDRRETNIVTIAYTEDGVRKKLIVADEGHIRLFGRNEHPNVLETSGLTDAAKAEAYGRRMLRLFRGDVRAFNA